MNNEIAIGEYRLVKDFENGARPVQVMQQASEIGEGYWWCRYSDGAVYDIHESELKPI